MQKERKLSKDEITRLENFEVKKDELISKGYKFTLLKVDIVKASLFSIFLMIPFVAIFYFWYMGYHQIEKISFKFAIESFFLGQLLFFIEFIIFIILHELVHGITWALFSKNGFRDISFGIIWKMLAPYCTCKSPLKRNQYLIGALTPFIFTGLLPAILGVYLASPILTIVGVLMIGGAAGDIIMSYLLLKYKSKYKETLVYDHPTEVGMVVFER